MMPAATLRRVNIIARVGSSVTVGVPDEFGGQATLVLDPPYVDPMFLATPGSTGLLLMVGPVPHLLPGDVIVAGDPLGAHVELTASGMYAYVLDDEGLLVEAIRLGTAGDDFLAISDSSGVHVAAISSVGAGSFSAVTSGAWPTIGAPDWTGVGGSLDQILDRRPRGRRNHMVITVAGPGTTTSTGWREFSVDIPPGRMYRLSGSVPLKSTVAGDVAQVQIRATFADFPSAPAQPVLATAAVLLSTQEVSTVARPFPLGWVFIGGNVTQSTRFLICYSRIAGTGTISADVSVDEPARLDLQDIGPRAVDSATVVNDGSGVAVTPAPTTRTLTVDGSWSNAYKGDGTHLVTVTQLRQGSVPITGDRKALLGFRELTELAGATIDSVTLQLNAQVWKLPSGGSAVLGFHNKLVQPSGTLVGMTGITADVLRAPWSGLGAGFVDLTGYAPAEWASGVKRGIYLGVAQGTVDAADEIVGAFPGPADADTTVRPQLTITYTV